MKVKVRRMSEIDALKILVWHYAPPYSWYDFEQTNSDFHVLLKDQYYCVIGEKVS